ncbi:MAG: BON domain-containing protein [Gammaproteobacteria bacterium]|nr:BON domain-containing protein [Gammaproteobacteria bacterium]
MKISQVVKAAAVVAVFSSYPMISSYADADAVVAQSKQAISDTALTASVKSAYVSKKLFTNEPVSVADVHVTTTDGIVELTGTVSTKAEADAAVNLAQSVKGVRKVVSHLKVG